MFNGKTPYKWAIFNSYVSHYQVIITPDSKWTRSQRRTRRTALQWRMPSQRCWDLSKAAGSWLTGKSSWEEWEDWEDPLFLWWFSIAMLNYQRVFNIDSRGLRWIEYSDSHFHQALIFEEGCMLKVSVPSRLLLQGGCQTKDVSEPWWTTLGQHESGNGLPVAPPNMSSGLEHERKKAW